MVVVLVGTVSSSIFGFRKLFLQSLVEAGHEVYIFTSDLTPELQVRAFYELNVKARRYSLSRSGVNPLADIRNAWLLWKKFKELKPDVVFCYFSKPVIWGAFASRLAGVKNRFGMLEGLGFYFTNVPSVRKNIKRAVIKNIQVLLFRLSLPTLKGVVFLNPDDRDELLSRYRIPVREAFLLGGIGLDLAEFPFSSPQRSVIRFIFIGRLLVEKGINEFLEAAEIIKNSFPEAEFVVLGTNDPENPGSVDENHLENLVKRKIIIHPGAVKDVAVWLKSSSVFVLPSYREGVPRSTQEAMSVGRAVITTDAPGCRETVIDGYNGFVVPPYNGAAVAAAMERFIHEPLLITEMGLKSRELAEKRFDAEKVNEKLVNFIFRDEQ